jgi:hypothetical protein
MRGVDPRRAGAVALLCLPVVSGGQPIPDFDRVHYRFGK